MALTAKEFYERMNLALDDLCDGSKIGKIRTILGTKLGFETELLKSVSKGLDGEEDAMYQLNHVLALNQLLKEVLDDTNS